MRWTINRAVIEALPHQVDVPAADGSVKSPSWEGYDSTKMTIGGDRSGSVAGSYNATFTPTANYQWWDGTTGAKNATWSIASIIVTIPTQKNIPNYDGASKTPEWDGFDEEHSNEALRKAQMKTDTAVQDADAMNVDQEYRLTMLELGLSADDI